MTNNLSERQRNVVGWIICVGLATCVVIIGLAVSIKIWGAIL